MSHSTEQSDVCCGDCDNCIKCSNEKEHAPGVPISLARVGERGTIVRISGKEETRRFLAGLGFTTGSEVSTVCQIDGNLVLEVKGSKIAIDRSMASRIMFCPES